MVVSCLTRPVELPANPGAARRELARMLADDNWEGDVDAVVLAVHEAMVNAERHGGGLTGAAACMDDGDLVVMVSNRGPGFGLPEHPDVPEIAAERGRGLFLIRQLASHVELACDGGDVRLLLRFAG